MPPRLVLLNTEQTVDDSRLVQTAFWLQAPEDWYVEVPDLRLDQSGHEPTPEEDSLAPFYQDPSQRILVVEFFEGKSVFVMKTEALLELARGRGGTELGWEQWRAHVVEAPADNSRFLWVSGPRLFCVRRENENAWLDVYDFSPRASARHMQKVAYYDAGIMWQIGPNTERRRLPQHTAIGHYANGGHDSIVFLEVITLAPKT